jgi:hypothetical protein
MHSKHKEIAATFKSALPSTCTLIADEACGGNQRITLFSDSIKSRKTEYCNVDLLVLQNNKIKILAEIEESNVKPTQICGKFLASALSKFFIHQSLNDEWTGMSSNVAFIQILDNSKLKENTSKIKQWKALEKSINDILPIKGSSIAIYKLFSTDELDDLRVTIQNFLR